MFEIRVRAASTRPRKFEIGRRRFFRVAPRIVFVPQADAAILSRNAPASTPDPTGNAVFAGGKKKKTKKETKIYKSRRNQLRQLLLLVGGHSGDWTLRANHLSYVMVVTPLWTYGLQLWGCYV